MECGHNQTMVTELVLFGFGNLHRFKIFLFVLFLLIYILTLTGNLLIISVITVSPRLHSPMYFFLSNLSICELIFTTNIIPNMLCVVWREGVSMTVYGCITQFFVYCLSTCIECLLLTVMAFDRYLAICNPLRYSSVMNFRICNNLILCCWLSGFIFISSLTITVFHLQFCGSNIIDLFCDLAPILQIASSDISIVETESLFMIISLGLFPFMIIIVSYSCIFYTILRIPSVTGRQKAFSTCSSHLTSVNIYFGTLLTIYFTPSHESSLNVNKILSLLYVIGTPLFNPIIYSLRNQEMKTCLQSYIFLFRVRRY